MKLSRWLWVAVLVCMGCDGIRGKHVDFARYDAKEDSFVHLHSWTNITCEKPRDLDHLQSIWNRRAAILISPLRLFSVHAIERQGGRMYQWIDLRSSSSGSRTTDPVIDFDSVRIVPGEFYQDEHGRLGYYHTEVIPGETMRAIVVASFSGLANGFVEDRLSKSGVPTERKVTWDEFRQSMSHHLDQMAGVTDSPKPAKDDGDLPFDVASIRMLRTAATKRSFKVTRVRDQFVIVVPLSSEDSHESVATFDVYRKKLAQLVKDGRPMAALLEGAEAVSMKAVDEPGLEMTVEFSGLAKAGNKFAKEILEEPLDAKEGKSRIYEETVKAIKQRGIPVSPARSIDDLIAEFFQN